MAYGSVQLKNDITNQFRNAPVGFSWTVLFFGGFPALFRSDWKWAIIMFILQWVTFGLSGLVFMFIYNKMYLKDLLMNGYKITNFTSTSKDQVGQYVGMDLNQLVTNSPT
jgi:hypothetical protein